MNILALEIVYAKVLFRMFLLVGLLIIQHSFNPWPPAHVNPSVKLSQ